MSCGAELDEIPVVSSRKITLEQWFDEWSPKHFRTLSATTTEGYRYCWLALPDELKNALLDKLTRETIQQSLDSIGKPSMQGHAGAFLTTILKGAVKAGLIHKSPCFSRQTAKKKLFASYP